MRVSLKSVHLRNSDREVLRAIRLLEASGAESLPYHTIAAAAACTVLTVGQAVYRLQAAGLLEVERREGHTSILRPTAAGD